jgi:hypothetical protein
VRTERLLQRIGLFVAIALFVLLYPVLISVYVFLPLFIGFAGWLLIRGVEGGGYRYLIAPLVYLINLEVNLSLPLLMSLFATLLYYLLLYDRVLYLKRCKLCVALISVMAIDGFYLATLMIYDALMDTTTVLLSSLQWYSLIADLVMVML